MTGALNTLRQQVAEALNGSGVRAVLAMEPDRARRWDEPVAAVALEKAVYAPGGFRDYLGLRENEETGGQEELYGRAVELTLGLDIYAGRELGESACRETADRMAEALAQQGAGGLTVREFRAGKVEFLDREGLYRLPVSCLCGGWLVAAVDSGGAFTDFELKGRTI